MPREESFNKKYGLNKTYHEITNRLRTIIDRAQSPEALKRALSKDKAGIFISDEEVAKIFENKKSIKKMPDEDLYALLKPSNAFEKYSSGLNNSAVAETMDKNGLKVLVVDTNKVLPTGGTTPRANPDNPYLSLNLNEQDWLRSIEMKNGAPKTSDPVQKGISDIVSKQNAQNVAQTAGNVLKKVTPVETTPAEAPIVKPEAPIAPVATEVSTPAKTYPKLASAEPKTPMPEDVKRTTNATEEFFNDMIGRIEDSKADLGSPQTHDSSLMAIIDGFKRNNPGLPDADFKTAMSMAKGRATAYVRDLIDTSYDRTKVFGTDDVYARAKTSENKNVLVRKYNDLKKRGNEVPLKPFEKTEMEDLKSKIKEHVKLDNETNSIRDKAAAEKRDITPEEKARLEELSKRRFTLTQDYLAMYTDQNDIDPDR